MGFAARGITHCYNCGKSLNDHEIGLCKWCEEKYSQEMEEYKFKKAVEKQVKIELAKINNKIEKLVLEDIDGKKTTYSGYWKDNVFHLI